MRGILHLIRRDLRHSVMNVMAIIVMFGLVVIPSLFTWFNVLASWDPFGNTKNLTVAVASTIVIARGSAPMFSASIPPLQDRACEAQDIGMGVVQRHRRDPDHVRFAPVAEHAM